MNTVKCPICNEEHDVNNACPKCSFEQHIYLCEDMAERFKVFEENRVKGHREWWEEQQQQITKLNDSITEKEKIIAGLNTTISEKDQAIADINESIKAKNQEIERLKKIIAEKDKEIDDLNTKIAEKEKEIECLKQSAPICYILQKEFDEIIYVYPIFEGETIVGVNPQVDKHEGINICRIVTADKVMKAEHFKIVTHEDGSVSIIDICDERLEFGDYQGRFLNQGEEEIIANGNSVFIGGVQLILFL